MTITRLPEEARGGLRYPTAIDHIHATVAHRRLVASPAGRVVASLNALPGAPPGPLHRFGLAVVEAPPGCEPGIGPIADEFALALLDLHLDLVRDALRGAMVHLDGRVSAGTSLLSKQLVQGACADIAMRLREERAIRAAMGTSGRRGRWQAHQRIVRIGRSTMRLLGASGFLAGHPSPDLHLAEVTGQVYLQPDGNTDD